MRLRKKPWIEVAMEELKDKYVLMHNLEDYKGHWQEHFPGKRLCLEIGCGKGRFLTGMAELHPEKAFIGVETQHDISYYPGKYIMDNKLENAVVICANAEQLEDWFEPGEIKELYLNFSDPWPKKRNAKRRLTSPLFLERYKTILAPGGRIFFKTDNRPLFDYSLETFAASGYTLENVCFDLHGSPMAAENIMTEYERNFSAKGFAINYLEAFLK